MKKNKYILIVTLLFIVVSGLFADNIQNLIAQKKYDEALILLKKNILPDDVDSRLRIAYIYAWTKKYSEAEKNFRIVLKLTPDYFDAVFGLANVYFWQGKYSQAIKLLEKYKNSKVAEKSYTELYKNEIALHKYSQANKITKIGRLRNYQEFKNIHKIPLNNVAINYSEAQNVKKINGFTLIDYWRYYDVTISRKINQMTVLAGYSNYYRYDKYDNLFFGSISNDLASWLTSSLQYNLCDKADFLEQYSLVNDNYLKFRRYNLVFQISETYKLYPSKSVMIYTPGINFTLLKYFTSTYKYYYSIDSNNKVSASFQVMESYDISKVRVVASYSKGNEIVDSSYDELLDSETYLGQFKYNFFKNWSINGSYSFYSDERNTVRNEFGGGLEVKF